MKPKDWWQLLINGQQAWSGRSLFTLIFGFLPKAKPGELVKIRRLNRVSGRYELQDRTVWPGKDRSRS